MANKRIRSRRPDPKEDLLAGLDLPTPKRQRQYSRRASEINEEIHRLECVIAAAPTMQKQRDIHRRNTLPPMEEFANASPRRRTQKNPVMLPLHARRQRSQQRLLLGAQLVFFILAIVAVAGWMKQWTQW
jgi:hypothetical protein